VAWDTAYYEHLGTLCPQLPGIAERFGGMPEPIREKVGTLSATLQGGYLILAARALGLDCGPMGGFDNAKVDAAFFPDGKWRSLFLVNLGHADTAAAHPRNPRLSFAEACRIA
jgi:3-hydroxypropanoate dehydrogenase